MLLHVHHRTCSRAAALVVRLGGRSAARAVGKEARVAGRTLPARICVRAAGRLLGTADLSGSLSDLSISILGATGCAPPPSHLLPLGTSPGAFLVLFARSSFFACEKPFLRFCRAGPTRWWVFLGKVGDLERSLRVFNLLIYLSCF